MAFTTWSLTGNLADLIGTDLTPDKIVLYLHPSADVFTDGLEEIRVGDIAADVADDGTFTITGIPDSTTTLISYKATVRWESADGGRPDGMTSDWFNVTANTTLAAKWEESVVLTPVDVNALASISAAAALGATNDTATASFVNDTGSLTRARLTEHYVPRLVEQAGEGVNTQAFSVDPVTAGHAPFEFRFNSFPNTHAPGVPEAGDYNHAMHIGFNVGRHNGGPVTAGAPGWFLGMEDRYPDPVGDLTTGPEFYLEYVSPDGASVPSAVLRPMYFRLQNGWNNTPANKSATIQLDIGQGPDGSVAVWGGIQNGVELLEITQQQVFSLIPLSVLGSIQVTALTGDANFLIKANEATSKSTITFQPGSEAAQWQVTADENGALYTFDLVNSRVHSVYSSGAGDTLATTEYRSNLRALGHVRAANHIVGDNGATKNLILRPDTANGLIYFGTYDMNAATLQLGNNTVGFFNTAPVTKRTGVAVTAAGIHAALVQLGLIS